MTEPFLSAQWHRVAALRPRLRHHVQIHRHVDRGAPWYVVEDDLSGRQHRFSAPAYLLIALFDGVRTVQDVWQDAVGRLDDAAPTQDAVIRILAQLHAADLLQSNLPPVTSELLERHDQARRTALVSRFANPLSLRLPLVDPDHVLARTIHLVRPLFGPLGAIVALAIGGPALLIAAMDWPALTNDFTDRVLSRECLTAMALIYPVTKLVHELGHSYAVKRWGGAVHELGVLLLILLPMPYVDASASAAFRHKGRRIAVAAAGMMAEMTLAGVALLIWQASEPGTVRSLAYAIVVTAGLGTVLFNANPLMRLDGYYIFADLIEMPNLAQRSGRYWLSLIQHVLVGPQGPDPRGTAVGSERLWCLLYAPLSFAYRLTVLFGVSAFVATHHFYAGVAIGAWSVATTLLWPLAKGLRHVLIAPSLDGHRLRAGSTLVLVTAALCGLLFMVPLPLHTTADGVVWLPDSSIVRATEDGTLAGLAARPGDHVGSGDPLFLLDDREVTESLPLVRAQVSALEARLASEIVGSRTDAGITREELAIKTADLAEVGDRVAGLTVRAGAAGMLVIPNADDLAGRFVRRGDVLGFVVPGGSRIVRVVVGQDDVDLVRHRCTGATLVMPGPNVVSRRARVLREVPGGSQRLPSPAFSDAGGGRLASDPRDQSRTTTLRRTFAFDLQLTDDEAMADFGQRVLVRFDQGSEPIAVTVYRRLRQLVLSRFDA